MHGGTQTPFAPRRPENKKKVPGSPDVAPTRGDKKELWMRKGAKMEDKNPNSEVCFMQESGGFLFWTGWTKCGMVVRFGGTCLRCVRDQM